MPFETPITIRDVIARIQARELLLPGIQREFVWGPEQISRLFDSLLRGYPIGSFLFWKVDPDHQGDYKFYEFLRDFHERDGRHNPKATPRPGSGLTAVLDGQQRLTSLYLGLLGTYTDRRKYARKGGTSSYSRRKLYLNLTRPTNSEDAQFDFAFRESDDDFVRDEGDFWFRVGRILEYKRTTDVFDLLIEHQLIASMYPKTCLVELHRSITELPLINYFTEVEQDLDRVLNIFIRVNSGGTPLSYSDLLLSIAVAQWEERDAREAIHGLVDEINRDYGEFAFDRDFVLKCCLMLADVDLRWKVENFNQQSMRVIEELWPRIADAIRLTVNLLAGFGFTGKTLASANAVIPIAYYLFKRGSPNGFADSAAYLAERSRIQTWLNIVLLKQVFGGVPDNVLRRMRDVIRNMHEEFPAAAMAADLATTPFTLSFRRSELEALLDAKYGGRYTFPVLAMLYPSLDFRHKLHQDHMHPRSHFTSAQLRKRGIQDALLEQYMMTVDQVPNLQLLEGQPNIEKSATPFAEWLVEAYPDAEQRRQYEERNFVPDSPTDFGSYLDFIAKRRSLMLRRLADLVGFVGTDEEEEPAVEAGADENAAFHLECMRLVGKKLGVVFAAETQTCFSAGPGGPRAVCAVSKLYRRGQYDRYWFAMRPAQVAFLKESENSYVVLGCGSPLLTLVIPSSEFLPSLAGMRQTEEEGGRSYWHVELFGSSGRMDLGQSLWNSRTNVSRYLLSSP